MSIRAKGFIGYCACGCGQPLITVGTKYRRGHCMSDPKCREKWERACSTPEYKAKQSAAQRGKKQSEETIKKRVESCREYRENLTEEQRAELNRPLLDPEVRIKGAETRKRLYQEDPEFRQRRQDVITVLHSPEVRKKAARALKKRWEEDRARLLECMEAGQLRTKETREKAQATYRLNKEVNDANRAAGVRKPEVRQKIAKTLTGRKQPIGVVRKRTRSVRRFWNNLTPEKFNEHVCKCRKGSAIRPTKPECKVGDCLDELYPNEWRYNGTAEANMIIGGRVPDFVNVNGQKAVIEVFGSYFHDVNKFPDRLTDEQLVSHYNEWGFKCLVIWDYELKNINIVKQHIVSFVSSKNCKGKTVEEVR